MMASITRPIEEAMKDIPGSQTIRSSSGRGTAEIDVFFSWQADMQQSELYVLSRLSQIRSTPFPPSATTDVYRMNFSVFPDHRHQFDRPQSRLHAGMGTLRDTILKPKTFLRIPGVEARGRSGRVADGHRNLPSRSIR